MASMPSYDPNSFSDGIGRDEWRMLSDDERRPLYNKALQAMYPPGSTFKPVHALAILEAGISPEDIVVCGGGYQLGNRFYHCLGRHGPMNMTRAIAKSCNTYFYTMGRRIGIERIAAAAHAAGLGAKYELPVPSQSYGTVPDPAWKMRRFDQKWTESDTLNASIGQGYVLVTPLQLAVAAARIATGKVLVPELIGEKAKGASSALHIPSEYLDAVRLGMSEVVNAGTAIRSRLPLDGIQMAGKTGTAQVRNLSSGMRGGAGVPWKYRDHALFIFFAPVDNPRYAGAVVIEHGMHGSSSAAPVARDLMTFMYDRKKAMDVLEGMEAGWGGDIATRMAAESAAYQAAHNTPPDELPKPVPVASVTPSPTPSATPANLTAPQPPE